MLQRLLAMAPCRELRFGQHMVDLAAQQRYVGNAAAIGGGGE